MTPPIAECDNLMFRLLYSDDPSGILAKHWTRSSNLIESGIAMMAMSGCHFLKRLETAAASFAPLIVPSMIPFQQMSARGGNVKAEATEIDLGWLNN